MNGRISILPTFAISSADTFLIGIGIVALVPGVTAAIIPIPWQGSQIRQIWRILRRNFSDDSKEVTEGVTSTPEIFGNKHSFVLTFFATNTIYVNCKHCKP